MTSKHQRISRSQTPSPSPRLIPSPGLRSPSASSIHRRVAPPGTASQATLTALPPRLHVTSAASTTVTSAASSAVNVDLSDGILLRDTVDDGDVAESEEVAEGVFTSSNDDNEERRKNLRDQLRRTLSQRDADLSLRPARRKGKSVELEQRADSSGEPNLLHHSPCFPRRALSIVIWTRFTFQTCSTLNQMVTPRTSVELYPQRQYFVITDAGKPVFVSRPRTTEEDLTSIAGITSALISVFADDTLSPSSPSSSNADRLRCINAGSTRITFHLRAPLYYVCVSKWQEPESVARMHLEYLHLQILSVITASQLRRIFERRTNFDLRRLLEGAESFLHTLVSRLQSPFSLCATLSSLSSLRLDASLRNRAGDILVPTSKAGNLDILYAVLTSGDSVITLVRPKKHSVHPIDLHILLNALHNPSIAATPASWLPICLPKFNPQGFVHAYVSFLETEQPPSINVASIGENEGLRVSTREPLTANHIPANFTPPDSLSKERLDFSAETNASTESHSVETVISTGSAETHVETQYEDRNEKGPEALEYPTSSNGLTLVIVSGGSEFEAVRRWSDTISKKLETTGVMSLLQTAVKAAPYACSELSIPGLRHFLYKSRVHVQATSPIWDEEYNDLDSRRRLITLYQTLHDAIHAKSGQERGLKLQYIRTEKEAVMGWITQPFELYVALSPRLPKSAVVGAANGVARWVKREEAKLFLRDAPIF